MSFPFPLRAPALAALLTASLLGAQPAAQAAPAASAAISLDTTPRAGQHQRQLIDIQAVMKMRAEAAADATDEQRAKTAKANEQMAQMGGMKMTMQMEQTMKVGQPDAAGWLPLTVTSGSKKGTMQMGDKVIPLPDGKQGDMAITARFNPRDFSFEVQKIEGSSPEMNALMRAQGETLISQALQLPKALSQQPLKVGESVTVPFNMAMPVPVPGAGGGMQAQIHYTLVRVDKGVAYFDLGMTLDVKLDTPLPKPAAAAAAASSASAAETTDTPDAPPRMLHVVMTGGGKGTSSLRLADRLPLAGQLTMDMKMTMDGPDHQRVLMDMDMAMQTKGESLAKPATKKKP
ncbi:hypothetical protein [Roseateles sp. BYS87W]|uniref:DUF4412 domain-containing protein n=1 Tax=Pelomonas baiyunensis TaxID=3299026 RepID=A0ABW7H402_9BURK